jgi:hypothetical protein
MPEEPSADRAGTARHLRAGTPAGGGAAGGVPGSGAPAGGVPVSGAAAGGLPGKDAPGNGVPAGGGGTPEFLEAGFFPRGAGAQGPGAVSRRPGTGSGFAAGDVLDVSLPGPALAGFADAVTWTGQGYAGVDDDELIGVLAAWQKTEAWAAAGRLLAVAELIRRRPVPRSGAPRGPGGPEDVIASDALRGPGSPGPARGPGGPSRPERPGAPHSPQGPGRQGPQSGGPGRGGPGPQGPSPDGPSRGGPGPEGPGSGGPGPEGPGSGGPAPMLAASDAGAGASAREPDQRLQRLRLRRERNQGRYFDRARWLPRPSR